MTLELCVERLGLPSECPDGVRARCVGSMEFSVAVEFDGGRLLPNNDDPQEATTSDLKDIGGITRQVHHKRDTERKRWPDSA